MLRTRLWCSVLLLAALGYAQAGPIYKVVGPDGKITYSDKPPPEASETGYEVVRGGQAPNAKTATPAPAAPAPAEQSATAKRAIGSNTAPVAANTAAPPPSAELEGAVIGVLGIADIVQQTQTVCTQAVPTSFAKYSAAVERWNGRNAALLARARDVLASSFDAATRHNIELAIREKNRGVFGPVASASAATKIGWCDKSFAAMDDGTMDVQNKPKLAGPLGMR